MSVPPFLQGTHSWLMLGRYCLSKVHASSFDVTKMLRKFHGPPWVHPRRTQGRSMVCICVYIRLVCRHTTILFPSCILFALRHELRFAYKDVAADATRQMRYNFIRYNDDLETWYRIQRALRREPRCPTELQFYLCNFNIPQWWCFCFGPIWKRAHGLLCATSGLTQFPEILVLSEGPRTVCSHSGSLVALMHDELPVSNPTSVQMNWFPSLHALLTIFRVR